MENYEIVKAIGNGAYGNVMLAHHKMEDREYAIKRIKFHDVQEADKVSIKNEVKILQTLKHPNLIPYKDSIMDSEGYLNIILVYCEGGDMYKRIKNSSGKNFPEEQVLDWLCQICLGLYFMHDNKILHRDLKPQNIFLKDGRVLLGDFGISKILDSTVELTSTCIGTPYYMSPDLYKYNKYSYKADIWALGCVLYELCNLRLPFEANSQAALSVKIMKGHYSPITSIYSKPLRELINKMLSLDAKERPYINEILKKPFIKRRVQLYVAGLVKRVDMGEEAREEVFLDTLIEQARKIGVSHDLIKDGKDEPISTAPSLKSYEDKEKKIASQISKEQREIERL
jgi:serine/threonine protein kinase